jgi:hypothetical protein
VQKQTLIVLPPGKVSRNGQSKAIIARSLLFEAMLAPCYYPLSKLDALAADSCMAQPSAWKPEPSQSSGMLAPCNRWLLRGNDCMGATILVRDGSQEVGRLRRPNSEWE